MSNAPVDNRRSMRIRNNGRDTITIEIPVLDADGKPAKTNSNPPLTRMRTLTLGSQDDAHLEGQENIVSPEITVTAAEYATLMGMPSFAGLKDQRKIDAWPVA